MAETSEAERIRELEAKVAELESARAKVPDLEWLRNSYAWKRTEYWAHPRWHKVGIAFTLLLVAFIAFSEWAAHREPSGDQGAPSSWSSSRGSEEVHRGEGD